MVNEQIRIIKATSKSLSDLTLVDASFSLFKRERGHELHCTQASSMFLPFDKYVNIFFSNQDLSRVSTGWSTAFSLPWPRYPPTKLATKKVLPTR